MRLESWSELDRKIGLLGTRVQDLLDENKGLRAVVAAQREAMQRLSDAEQAWRQAFANPTSSTFREAAELQEAWRGLRAALDAEGVSEPGGLTQEPHSTPGSLTSPVDTVPGAKP